MLTTRSVEHEVLSAMAEIGQKQASAASGISETRLSRWKSSSPEGGGLTLAEVASVLGALGLSVVPAGASGVVAMPAEEFAALHVLLRRHASNVLGNSGA
jgi:hypothetical protein